MSNEEAVKIQTEIQDKGLPVTEESDDTELEGTDEVVVGGDDVDDADTAPEDAEDTVDEQIAQQDGWRPKDEWDGPEEDWVPAREFNRRGELLRKIHNQNRQLKEQGQVITTLAAQQKKIFDAGYDKAKRELKSALRQANKDEDDVAANVIEDQLEQLETQRKQDTAVLAPSDSKPRVPDVAPEFVTWVKSNDWFTKYPEMRAFAESIGVNYAQSHPTLTNMDVYAYVTRETKKRFPERFGTTMRKPNKSGSPVDGDSTLTTQRSRQSEGGRSVSLSAEEKSVGRTLVKRGLYKDMNEYAADLKKFGVKE